MNDVALPLALRILVIDDNRAIHEDFRKIFGASRERAALSAAELALFGDDVQIGSVPAFEMDSAYQGLDGVTLVQQAQQQQRPYAMAFVDVRMPPGLDGIETAAAIWQHDPDIQIVICTAYSDYSWADMLAKLGRSDRLVILKKPFDTIEVLQLASALTEKWRLARQSRSLFAGLEARIAERTRDLVRLNRVYAVLSGINALIVRVRDRDQLFGGACRLAVEVGGFAVAIIAMIDPASGMIVPAASAGKDGATLAAIQRLTSLRDTASTTLVAPALKDKRAIVSNDSDSDPLLEEYARSGIRSVGVLPLVVADQAVGALALYSSEKDFFREDEMKLLTELADDVAFAIDHIDKQDRITYLAYYDELTGLANRSLFLERAAQYVRTAAAGGHQMALFLFDVERFNTINDSLGRAAGDSLLRQIAEWLTLSVGDASLLAHLDADHFAALLPVVKNIGEVVHVLDKKLAAFRDHPFHLNRATFRIAAKAGVTLFPDDGTNADTLFTNAAAALKKAKLSGERYLFYTQKMTTAMSGKLTLENQLRQAVDQQEFELHYQPKIDAASGQLAGAEALIRWNDPRTGLVRPGRFISILEETGLIHEVGHWALRQAVADHLRWRAAGLPAVRIAVNVSPLQLHDRSFTAKVEQALSVDARAPAGLELEITENMIMADIKRGIASLQAIRGMGISVAIDDFGTGFSSLSYLSKLPVDSLKIDRSFVIEMTGGPEGVGLVSTIITLAHSLKLKVVAEGVETEEQARLLRLLGCDELQGYLFSKAEPSSIFEARFLVPASPAA